MTRAALTAELAALDRFTDWWESCQRIDSERAGAIAWEGFHCHVWPHVPVIMALIEKRRAELEEISADLDNGAVTARQMERYPVKSKSASNALECASSDFWKCDKGCGGEYSPIYYDCPVCSRIPATLTDESHSEVGT